MQEKIFDVYNLSDTDKVAVYLANIILTFKKKLIITLEGELGSGKTFLTSKIINYIAKQNHFPQQSITSPTFNLLKIYNLGDINIYHYDLYRIKNQEELYELSMDDAFEAIAIIEWPALAKPLFSYKPINVTIEFAKDGHRIFKIVLDKNY